MDLKKLTKIVDVIVKKRLQEVIKEEVKKELLNILLENNSLVGKNTVNENSNTNEQKSFFTINKNNNNVSKKLVNKQYTKNPMINNILNNTKVTSDFYGGNMGLEDEETFTRLTSPAQNSIVNLLEDLPSNINVSEVVNNNVELIDENVEPNNLIDSVPKDLSAFPDYIQNALTKNYSSLLKKSIEKSKQRSNF